MYYTKKSSRSTSKRRTSKKATSKVAPKKYFGKVMGEPVFSFSSTKYTGTIFPNAIVSEGDIYKIVKGTINGKQYNVKMTRDKFIVSSLNLEISKNKNSSKSTFKI